MADETTLEEVAAGLAHIENVVRLLPRLEQLEAKVASMETILRPHYPGI